MPNWPFISGRTNQQIGKKPPSECFPQIAKERGDDALTSQLISADPRLRCVESYREFLEERRRSLAEEIDRFMKRVLEP